MITILNLGIANKIVTVISPDSNTNRIIMNTVKLLNMTFARHGMVINPNNIRIMNNQLNSNISINKEYIAAIVINGTPQELKITANNVMQAYNNIKNTYGIIADTLAVIYEINQNINHIQKEILVDMENDHKKLNNTYDNIIVDM